MRILVVNNFYPPRVGGSSHLSDALARGYARRGHDVLVVTAAYGDAPAEEWPEPRMRVVRVPATGVPQTRLSVTFDLSFATRPSLRRRLGELLDEFRPDVMHQHGQFFDLTWATSWYSRTRRIPALLSIHTRLENPKARYHGVFRWIDKLVVAPILRRYRPHLVVMDVQMDAYIKTRYRGCYAGLHYIPVGVDPNQMSGGSGALARQRLGVGDAPLIVSIGHVIPLRDRVTLVESLPKVLAECPDTKLVVVGTVYYKPFQIRAAELGVADAVMAIGPVPRGDVPDFLAAAAVETHDLQGYGMGTAVLESMAAGVPIVAAVRADNFPGVELISGTNCVLVPVDDPDALAGQLVSLLKDADARARIGTAEAALVAEHFSLDVVLDQHLRVLGRLVGAATHSS
jgi:glycosyltransferase involved in cell wall biosynthesis